MIRKMALVALLAAAASGTLLAHHSYSAYDTTQTVSIEGTVVRVEYANPHVLLIFKSVDNEMEYSAEFPPATSLRQTNFTAYSLKAGDIIVAKGSPMKDREIHRISLMKELRRPADGWLWNNQLQTPR